MNKPQVLIIAFLISLSICALASTQVEAIVSDVNLSPIGPVTLDVGQVQMFSVDFNGGSGLLSYDWKLDGASVVGNSQTFTYSSNLGSHSLTVEIFDFADFTITASNTVSVTVNPAPTVSVSPVGPLTMNVGQIQVFTSTASGGSGTIHYQWYVDGSAVGSDSRNFSYTAAGASHLVTCKVTDSASTPVTSAASNAVSVTVNPALTLGVTPGGPLTMDVDQQQTFTAAPLGGTGTKSFQWYLNGLLVAGPTGANYTFSASSVGSAAIYSKVTDSASSPMSCSI